MDIIKYHKNSIPINERNSILQLLNIVFNESETVIQDNQEEICRIAIFDLDKCIAQGVGYIRQMNIDKYNFKAGIIGGIAVDETYRKQGLAKQILSIIHEEFDTNKIKHSFLFATNPNVYLSSGYTLLTNKLHIFDSITQEWHIWNWPNSMCRNFTHIDLPNGTVEFNGQNY